MLLPVGAARNCALGTNRNALYKLLHDARQRLQKRMLREGLTPDEVLAMFAGN